MRKFTAAVAAFALCAALLTGCGDGASSGGNSTSGGSGTQTANPTASPTANPTPTAGANSGAAAGNGGGNANMGMNTDLFSGENGITEYSAANLGLILDGLTGYGNDTAGGSLHTARAAGDLLRFASLMGDQTATLGADAQAWLNGLSDDRMAELRTNWAAVREQARSLAADPASQAELMNSAGYNFDFTTLNLAGSDAFLNTLDSLMGAQMTAMTPAPQSTANK